MTCSWLSHDFLMTFVWLLCDFLMTFSWFSHGLLMTLSWLSQKFIMTFSLISHDFFVTFSWLLMTFWVGHGLCRCGPCFRGFGIFHIPGMAVKYIYIYIYKTTLKTNKKCHYWSLIWSNFVALKKNIFNYIDQYKDINQGFNGVINKTLKHLSQQFTYTALAQFLLASS